MRHFGKWLAISVTAMTFCALPVGAVFAQATPPTTGAAVTLSTPTVEDMALLKKAVDGVQKNPVQLTSDLKVKASGSGVVVLINETIKVSGQFPGKFKSDVTLLQEDGTTPASVFQVIGDGSDVYTFRSDTKKYAVQTVDAFQKDFAMPVIGVMCGLLASSPPWGGDDAPLDASGVLAFLDALKTSGMVLESGAGANGRRVYGFRPAAEGGDNFKVLATADPQTGSFVTMEMTGKQGEWSISITETIRSLTKLSRFDAPMFTPPADAEKVAKLSVWPF